MKKASIIFLISFGLYIYTAAPDLMLVDSGELALAAYGGGVAHPPGVPLWLITAKIFTQIIPLEFLVALNLMSAFWMALAVLSVYLCSINLLTFLDKNNREIPAFIAAIVFATSYNPWTWAGIIEVYALNTFLIAGSWAAAWSYAVQINCLKDSDKLIFFPPSIWRSITLAILLAMLGLANHHATAIIIFPPLFFLFYILNSRIFFSFRFLGITAVSLCVTSSLYLHLYIAGKNDTGLGWGGINDFYTLFQHVTGSQYSHLISTSLETTLIVIVDFFRIILFGSGWMVAILVILAIAELIKLGWKLGRREAKIALVVLILAFTLNLSLSSFFIAGTEDRMAYDLPATIIWCLLSAIGLNKLMDTAFNKFNIPKSIIMICLLTLPPIDNIYRNLPLCNNRHDNIARSYVEDTLAHLPEGALVITSEWNLYSPYIYLRHAEGWRDDLHVIDILLLRRNWYLEYLKREMPDIIKFSQNEFDRFEEELVKFNSDHIYNFHAVQNAYIALIMSFIKAGQIESESYTDWSSFNLPHEQDWLVRSTLIPDNMLLRIASSGDIKSIGPLLSKNPATLKLISERLTIRALGLKQQDKILARHKPYRKVWKAYTLAVEASLLAAAQKGPVFLEQTVISISGWFPDTKLIHDRLFTQNKLKNYQY